MAKPSKILPPYLRDAVEHGQRLAAVLDELEARSARRTAELWLVGRADEVDCYVEGVVAEWSRGVIGIAEAGRSIHGYMQVVHRGLAVHFGELAPSCCIQSLVVTASPASYVSVTSPFPASTRVEPVHLTTTWGEVDEGEIVEVIQSGTPR